MDQQESMQPPLDDYNSWYYPSHGYTSDEEHPTDIQRQGNWGRKSSKGARWIRKGKMAAWGSGLEDWEGEERARKRLKTMLADSPSSPPTPELPHLRSPSPPLVAPYPEPVTQHLSFTSFVMDKAVTHSFRTPLLDDLELATDGLIEGEATLRRALGKLWRVMHTDPDMPNYTSPSDPSSSSSSRSLKQQLDQQVAVDPLGEEIEQEDYIFRAPNLDAPNSHKIFLTTYADMEADPGSYDPSHFAAPEVQLDSLEKSLATLRELQDDTREYVERLQEIREALGEARAHRAIGWDLVRDKALKELKEAAFAAAAAE
ncbi:hypothetical protein BDV98DRAFT_559467 [Pterulicium gracile]|uniref:Transcriptional regulatory protein RXT2 N-terminal domain-containing protein n=1 Tax=Pterulicium gracile TaxID=1884261 RepID=A0A5C3R105_9AGAR|nr:hypothetical protein BDV98DRAFT_559467 [Pterula gracilis]